jgi:hypothetical protein
MGDFPRIEETWDCSNFYRAVMMESARVSSGFGVVGPRRRLSL